MALSKVLTRLVLPSVKPASLRGNINLIGNHRSPATARFLQTSAFRRQQEEQVTCTIDKVSCHHEKDATISEVPTHMVTVNWLDGIQGDYPAVWLRDNCQCPKCFDKVAHARSMMMSDLDVNIQPSSLDKKNDKVLINWTDGHESQFESNWLRARIFNAVNREYKDLLSLGPKKVLWDANDYHEQHLKYHDFNAITSDEEKLFSWLNDLSTYGLTVVNNTPEDGLKALVKVIGFHRNTHYGEEFEVSSKDDANNLAYSTRDLGLRQDLTFYLNKPGIQFLQCVRQEDDQSGENQFCDGFMVEKLFKEKYPEQWKILTDVRIGWHDEGVDCYGEFCKDHQAPVFELDHNDEIVSINYNNQVRDKFGNIPLEKVQLVYNALKLFDDVVHSEEMCISFKLKPGECAVFDNLRVLHGRTGYSSEEENGTRFYKGCYTDWDEVLSKLNVLRKQLEL